MVLGDYILADVGPEDIPIKLIIGVIILILWALGAMANLAKKQQQSQQGRPQPGQPFDPHRAEMERMMRQQMEAARREQAAEALARGPIPAGYQFPQQQPSRQPQPLRAPAVPPMRARAQPQQQRPAALRSPPPPPPIPRQQASRPRGGAGPVVPQRRTKKAQQRQQQQQPRRPAAEPVIEELTGYSEGPSRPGVRESEIGVGTAPASPARRAAAAVPVIRLTPQSLRQQFILTEILQPPLALREPPEAGSGRA